MLVKSIETPGLRLLRIILLPLLLTGCDPLVSLQGSFWPPWIIVMMVALPMTAIAHGFLDRLGVAEYLRPTLVVYPALWALMTFIAWLVAFPW